MGFLIFKFKLVVKTLQLITKYVNAKEGIRRILFGAFALNIIFVKFII